MTNNANNQTNNYDDTGIFDDNNISQDRLCNSMYMHITPHNYLLCIPHIPYTSTKMDVARAVENHIITSGKGKSSEIENFQYVKNVTFVRAFDQVMFNNLTSARDLGSSSFGFGSGSKECYRDPWYKIALVNIEIQPHYSENRIRVYTNGENAFYNGVCRGDIVINSWPDAFFIAHPRTYFQPQQQTQEQQQPKNEVDRKEGKETQDSAFQKWMYEFKLRQLERKVKEHENTIRQYELDAIRTQNTMNEYAESIRCLTRQHFDSPDLHGLHSSNLQITSYISALNNRYARVCVSDTTFLEANRNMKLKKLNGFVIHACDECDTCQEMIYSIDHTHSEDRDEVFANIEKTICKINKSVQQFEKLHVNAERSLFGLRNRRVLEDFGAYLNTALEIMEEVTYRVSTFTQDLEYARCYGQLYRPRNATSTSLTLDYNYDYAEDADPVNDEEYDDNTGIESTQQMLHYFDQHNQELYKQQEQERQQQIRQEEKETSSVTLNVDTGIYHEEPVIIEGEQQKEQDYVSPDTTTTVDVKQTTTTVVEETNKNRKKSSWLPSWF